uniref:RgpF n=1 Tax=uncultured Synechococcus sp. TaxID=154535 RepID=A0A060BUX3_9SYNE|nr:RgpF [uncultured Synechococcus sp.]
MLSGLIVGGSLDVRKAFDSKWQNLSLKNRNRVAVFAAYSATRRVEDYVVKYLKGLREVASKIVVVFDNDLEHSELSKLDGIVDHIIFGRHGEYDFGSYKRGIAWLRENKLLENADDLILCNDSCYGPIKSFKAMFSTMESRKLDFWGATDNHSFGYHLQS